MTNILLSSSISFIFIINIINIFSPLLLSNAVSNCNDSCRDLNDCSGQLICVRGRCVDDPNAGTQICKGSNNSSTPPPPKNRLAPAPPSMMPPFPFLPRIPPPTPPKNQPTPSPPIIICRPVPPPPPPPRFQPQPLPTPIKPPRPCFWIPHPPRTFQPQPLVKTPTPEYCIPSGFLTCRGQRYPTYTCSPPVNNNTKAKLTYNDFNEGGDGGVPSACDGKYHKNSESIVALSTGWFDGGSRCGKNIMITASNGRNTTAIVVDECDSRRGCDKQHADQPPCKNNIVEGSGAVWKALRLDKNIEIVNVTWSMA